MKTVILHSRIAIDTKLSSKIADFSPFPRYFRSIPFERNFGLEFRLEPLVVDKRGHLLAGGHRKAALASIKENNPQVCDQHFPDDLVPVRMMAFDISAQSLIHTLRVIAG
jgi:hypothetical protein